MEVFVDRHIFTTVSTGGIFIVEDMTLCFTLEDRIRGPGIKVPKTTAIAPGRYRVVIDFSQRFQRMLPHVLDVPQYSGIRWHPGNRATDTEGCLLPGLERVQDGVLRSREAFVRIMNVLEPACRREKVFVTYRNINPPKELLAA
ncbi:MAG: hypothetical protein HY791_02845 [Deltaproteobacteria bacterium]|nr:hypothetical protein [Deltaproteobacteria bacterium]